MKIDSFFAELKRRNVYKVAVAYGAKRATKGFALKSATPIRKTDLDESSALCASAIKIDDL